MWSKDQIVADLKDLGLPAGSIVLAHASMRQIGAVQDGASGLLDALKMALGPEGSIVSPAFTLRFRDPVEWKNPPEGDGEIARLRSSAERFHLTKSSVDLPSLGVFAETLRLLPEASRSAHPTHSFCATGPHAAALTKEVPIHFPLGTSSVPARIHANSGYVLLLGVGQEVNISLHLAEVWADTPYSHRPGRVKAPDGQWLTLQGMPGCTEGFSRIDPVLRQSRILHRGYVGNAPSALMRMDELISMGIAMLRGSAESLLCDSPLCKLCVAARRFTHEQDAH